MDKNKKNKQLLIALPVLLIVACIVWVPNFQDVGKNRASSNSIGDTDIAIDTEELYALISASSEQIQRKRSSFDDWSRNPFMLKGEKIAKEIEPILEVPADDELVFEAYEEPIVEPVDVVLNGIFWNERKPSALINDEVLGVGAQFGKYEVVQITRDVVTIKHGDYNFDFKVQE